jgi:hypothetical protein
MVATTADFSLGIYEILGGENESISFGIDWLSSHSWAASGLFTLTQWYFKRQARIYHNAPIQFVLNPFALSFPLIPYLFGMVDTSDTSPSLGVVNPGIQSSPVAEQDPNREISIELSEAVKDLEMNLPDHDSSFEEDFSFLSSSQMSLCGWESEGWELDEIHKPLLQSPPPIAVQYHFDWRGWGDLFFLPGGLAYALATYSCYLWFGICPDCCWILPLFGAIAYLIDSILYYFGLGQDDE